VSFQVGSGEFVALAGPNGSGKTTLLRLLLGLLRPTTGTAELFGDDPRGLRDRGRLGYVPQRGTLAPDLPATVAEVVASGRLARRGWWRRARASDREATDHALEAVALAHLRRRPVRELSGGQQQRVLIAKALASDPELLVLDEPIAGVDADSQARFRDSVIHLVQEHDASVLLVSHELGAVADDLDRVVVMKRKIVFDGTPADLTATGVSLGVHRDDLPLWLEELG
jgi:zinc transport system ATP-binding protein